LLENIIHNVDLSKFSQSKNSAKIKSIKDWILVISGTNDQIKNQIESEYFPLKNFDLLHNLCENIENLDFDFIQSKADSLISAIQLISVFQSIGKTNFNKALKYLEYKSDRSDYDKSIAELNSTRFPIKSKEHKRKLIVEWPKAHKISNGQRDILTFIALLIKAKKQFKKTDCILIIDEVFDYLDDANLIAFQSYLDQYYFHYNILDGPNLAIEFAALGIERNWADSANFHKKIQRELRRYIFEEGVSYDTIAVCIALRVIIENLAYELLNDPVHKNVFINNINGTKNKLEFCISKGRNIPSSYFLLGLIYNNSLHLKPGQDITKQLSIKLDNQIIKNMIRNVYESYRNL